MVEIKFTFKSLVLWWPQWHPPPGEATERAISCKDWPFTQTLRFAVQRYAHTHIHTHPHTRTAVAQGQIKWGENFLINLKKKILKKKIQNKNKKQNKNKRMHACIRCVFAVLCHTLWELSGGQILQKYSALKKNGLRRIVASTAINSTHRPKAGQSSVSVISLFFFLVASWIMMLLHSLRSQGPVGSSVWTLLYSLHS